ncbi:MAG: hypothetical protein ACREBQ_08905 [Nitrososphaerales archaeon]
MVRNRFPHFFLRHILVIVALGMGGVRSAQAQFGFLLNRAYAPQARSEEELDKYLEIITDSNPQTTVQEVNTFIAEYPQSELLGIAFQYQMIAYQRLNNFKGVLRAGKEALKLQPDNANTLLTLAAAIPDGVAGKPGAGPLLERANSYARGALQELGRMQIPRAIPLDHWKMMRAEMAAQAHEALVYVAAEM